MLGDYVTHTHFIINAAMGQGAKDSPDIEKNTKYGEINFENERFTRNISWNYTETFLYYP